MIMQRPHDTTWLRFALAALLALAGAAASHAQTVPTGFQEYIVLGHEEHVYNLNNRPVQGQAFVGYALSGGMRSIVSATASSDDQIVTYDHWEDGLEPDKFNPVQPTSLIFGNANSADGRACDFIPTRACIGVPAVDDVISRSETLNLASTAIPSGNQAAPACATNDLTPPNFGLTDCVPIPRTAASVRFDGGDRLIASGGPVTLVHVQDPTANIGGVLGGAVEVLPRQAVGNATSYSVPVGEDTFTALGGTNTAGMPFRFVDLNLVAFENNTAVQVTSPGAGTVNFVLNEGQHWSSRGAIDLGAGPTLTINAGTKVSVNKAVAGLIFASSTGFYATRTYALLPDLLHGNDYVITAPGDDPGVNGNAVHDFYVYNPDPANGISVTSTDSIGTNTFTVPANSVVAYSAVVKAQAPVDRPIPNGSTVRLTSSGNFWGITAYDSRNVAFDWGHSWLATDFLTETYTIPFAPDNPNRAPGAGAGTATSGASPAYVAATEDNTCVRVDFDNDTVLDQVSNATGALVPFAGTPTCNDGYLINAQRHRARPGQQRHRRPGALRGHAHVQRRLSDQRPAVAAYLRQQRGRRHPEQRPFGRAGHDQPTGGPVLRRGRRCIAHGRPGAAGPRLRDLPGRSALPESGIDDRQVHRRRLRAREPAAG
jgi:hypothetical protein